MPSILKTFVLARLVLGLVFFRWKWLFIPENFLVKKNKTKMRNIRSYIFHLHFLD